MKPLFAALSVALLLGTSISAQATEQTAPTDRSIQVYKKADLTEWNRENAAGGQGPLARQLCLHAPSNRRPRRIQRNRLADTAAGRFHRSAQTYRQ